MKTAIIALAAVALISGAMFAALNIREVVTAHVQAHVAAINAN